MCVSGVPVCKYEIGRQSNDDVIGKQSNDSLSKQFQSDALPFTLSVNVAVIKIDILIA